MLDCCDYVPHERHQLNLSQGVIDLEGTPRSRSTKTPYSTTGNLDLRLIKDWVIPDFHRRREAGELFCNPLTSIAYAATGPSASRITGSLQFRPKRSEPWSVFGKYSFDQPRFIVRNEAEYDSSMIVSRMASLMSGIETFSSNDKDLLNSQVDAEIGSGMAQLYVTLAEGKKTVSMIVEACRLLRKTLAEVRRDLNLRRRMLRTVMGRKLLLDEASKRWLEGRYGWRPFIFDIMSMIEAAKSRPVRFTARAKDVRSGTISQYNGTMSLYIGCGATGMHVDGTLYRRLRVGSTVDYHVDLGLDALSFGLFDILGTGWELIPYSFVIDWFINLGDQLQALQAFAVSAERVAWVTEIVEGTILSTTYRRDPRSTDVAISSGRWKPEVLPSVSCREIVKTKVRTPREIGFPALGFRFNMNWEKAIDAITLLRMASTGFKDRTRYHHG